MVRRRFAPLQGGRRDDCEFGHPRHDIIQVGVELPYRGGSVRRPMRVFNWFRYERSDPGYCTGRDEVSKGIQHAGGWELEASRHVSEWLEGGSTEHQIVLDFGAHIGWYAMLAELHGYEVMAVDASQEHLWLLGANAPNANRVRGWIGPETPALEDCDVHIRLLKLDLEGNESQALRVLAPLFARQLIEAVLMEVNPGDPNPVQTLMRAGFNGYDVDRSEREVATFPGDGQRNCLFVRR